MTPDPVAPNGDSRKPVQAAPARLSRRRKWVFRIAAITIIPPILFGLLEAGLRIAQYGHSTKFFLDGSELERPGVWIDNRDFGRWVFPRGLQNTPSPIPFVLRKKPPNTYRIFLLGESAAMGFPEPSFNFGRILEVLLRARYPETRVEVVNAAMTSINSHIVLSIARECTEHDPDLFVVHVGNNEVVGPYGAAGVLGPFSPSRPFIRANLSIRQTRTGQWFDSIINRAKSGAQPDKEWNGMAMFTGSQVRHDDPRLSKIHDHFRRNLSAICDLANSSQIPVVLCTIPVNLRDSAPFSSFHSPSLSTDDQKQWESLFQEGINRQAANDSAAAIAKYRQAERLDDQYADLSFRIAQCLDRLGDRTAAKENYIRSRDLDALRFRSDTRINQTIREVATAAAPTGTQLADAERTFEASSLHGAPGEDYFLEHVHMNFAGNYLLARTVFDTIIPSVDRRLTPNVALPAPSQQECARQLAYTHWSEHKIDARLNSELFRQPPFTGQSDRDERNARWRARERQTMEFLDNKELMKTAETFQKAIDISPTDWMLRQNYAILLMQLGDFPAAKEQLEVILSGFRHNVEIKYYYGQTLLTLGDALGAERQFREILRINPDPNATPVYLALANSLGAQAKANEGIEIHEQLLARTRNRQHSLVQYGEFLMRVGQLTEARNKLEEAVTLNGSDAAPHALLGEIAVKQKRPMDALRHFEEALRIRPDWPEVRDQVAQLKAGGTGVPPPN